MTFLSRLRQCWGRVKLGLHSLRDSLQAAAGRSLIESFVFCRVFLQRYAAEHLTPGQKDWLAGLQAQVCVGANDQEAGARLKTEFLGEQKFVGKNIDAVEMSKGSLRQVGISSVLSSDKFGKTGNLLSVTCPTFAVMIRSVSESG